MPRPDESSLVRLASARQGEDAFLAAYHLAAANRFERLISRAMLGPRLTMSYDPARAGGQRGAGHAVVEMTDTAAEARQKLNRLAARFPRDCWNVLFDVCGMGKGLQTIETERAWPRRSAKLVLRVALDQLAGEFGLLPHVASSAGAKQRGWLEERLPLIGSKEAGDAA